jgi:hypothetical protein
MKKVYALIDREFDGAKVVRLAIVSEKEMTLQEIATLLGGQASECYGDTGGSAIVFPRSLFSPTKKGDKHFHSGDILEYHKGSLYLCRIPEDPFGTALYVEELPVMEVEE